MTGELLESRNLCYVFKKICNFWENHDFIDEQNVKKFIFFLAILKCCMAPLDPQQNFMIMKYIFFLSIFVRSKVIAFFCEQFAKV